MTRNLLILFFLVNLNFSFSQNTTTDFDIELNKLTDEFKNIGVSSAYAIDGEIKWQSAVGFADKENNLPFETSTKVRIASITKLFTAVAIMQLEETDKIQLDDPISTYLTDFPQKSKRAITVRHLLAHISGIKPYKNSKEATTQKQFNSLEEAVNVFKNRKLKFEPGDGFLYSTYGYVVLGAIIEKVTGQSYDSYIQENIFEKAGMSETAIEIFGKQYTDKSQIYHFEKDKVVIPKQNNLSNRVPAGSHFSTVGDLVKFGNALLNYQLIKEESLNQMLNVSFYPEEGNPYGLGFKLFGPKDAEGVYFGHEGAQYGANSMIIFIPKLQSTIVTLSNTSETPKSNIQYFSVKILSHILESNKERLID